MTRLPRINRIATILQRWPVVYNWKKFEVGPKYTVEYRPECGENNYEVQSKGGAHIGLYPGVEEAIIAVLDLDPLVTIPQDLTEVK